jgi:uncharacterized protein YciI
MRTIKTVVWGVLLLTACENLSPATSDQTKKTDMNTAEETFNEALAKSVGADEYGMKQYVVAFLRSGPNRDRTPEEAAALQRAHLDNIKRMAEEGQLVVVGPFLDNGELRGIYIFNVETVEEAEALTRTDPAIEQGQLVMELKPWYGSAALTQVNEIHRTIAAKPI